MINSRRGYSQIVNSIGIKNNRSNIDKKKKRIPAPRLGLLLLFATHILRAFGRQLLGGTGSVLRKSNSISTTRTRHRAGIAQTATDRLEIKRRPRHYINCNIFIFFFECNANANELGTRCTSNVQSLEGYCLRDGTA